MKSTAPFLALVAATGLAACQPADEGAPSGAAPAPAAASTAPSPDLVVTAENLAGEYRVAGVDGADIDLPHGITAAITADRIDVTSDCIRFAWSYRFESGALTTERIPAASCRRAFLPEESAIAAAFDAAGMVRRTPANGIEFAGGGNSVLLFSQ